MSEIFSQFSFDMIGFQDRFCNSNQITKQKAKLQKAESTIPEFNTVDTIQLFSLSLIPRCLNFYVDCLACGATKTYFESYVKVVPRI